MAYVMDEEEQRAGQGSAPGATPATAAPSSNLGSAGGAPGTGFQNLAAYFGANQDAAKGQADSLVEKLDTAATEAEQPSAGYAHGSDTDAAEAARQDIANAQTQPGLATLYREDAPPTYTAGQAGLDAYLAGQAGGDRFAGLTEHFGPLDRVGAPDPVLPPDTTGLPGPAHEGKNPDPRGNYPPYDGDDPYDPRHPRSQRERY